MLFARGFGTCAATAFGTTRHTYHDVVTAPESCRQPGDAALETVAINGIRVVT